MNSMTKITRSVSRSVSYFLVGFSNGSNLNTQRELYDNMK